MNSPRCSILRTAARPAGPRRITAAFTATVLAAVAAGAVHAQATAASKSLEKCQKVAQQEAAKYTAKLQKTLSVCLQKLAREIVHDNHSFVDVSGAVATCQSQFDKIDGGDGNSVEHKVRAKIAKFCDPTAPGTKATHSHDDITGLGTPGVNQPLNSNDVSAYCGSFAAGAGTFDEWLDCLIAAGECHARQQVAVQFPSALSWLGELPGPFYPDQLATIAAIDQNDDGEPDLSCGPGIVPGFDAVLLATGQLTPYGAGSDGDIQAGAARAYTDNGDGTITDHRTGLMWEKKDDSGGLHDKDTGYTWCEDANLNSICDNGTDEMDGTVVTVLLDTLNDTGGGGASCFAGYCDWRLPNINELMSILDYQASGPGVDPVFHQSATCAGCTDVTLPTCSCAPNFFTWTSTTSARFPDRAWIVSFLISGTGLADKVGSPSMFARAVRGGL